MALTNLFREPRREITETLIGIGVIGGLICADYALAVAWLRPGPSLDGTTSYGERVALAMLIQPVAAALGMLIVGVLLVGVHAAGQGICNRLQDAGIHLRPASSVLSSHGRSGMSDALNAPPRDKRDAALDVAKAALLQIARDRPAARPTAYFAAKARFALDRIDELLR